MEPLNRPPIGAMTCFSIPAAVCTNAPSDALLFTLKAPHSPATQGKQTLLAVGATRAG